jgi:hypothetical protein
MSEETRMKVILNHANFKGSNNPNYIDGNSIKYSEDWNSSLKEKIRNRDEDICQNCGMTKEEHLIVYGVNLSVHHIDYNKENCNEYNLISLCLACHLRSNSNRNYWQKHYENKIISSVKQF